MLLRQLLPLNSYFHGRVLFVAKEKLDVLHLAVMFNMCEPIEASSTNPWQTFFQPCWIGRKI